MLLLAVCFPSSAVADGIAPDTDCYDSSADYANLPITFLLCVACHDWFGHSNFIDGRTMNRLAVMLAAAMLMLASLAHAMSFNVVTIDLRISNNQSGLIHYYVYAAGEIIEGDAERFRKALLSSHVSSNDDILVFLDFPRWLAF